LQSFSQVIYNFSNGVCKSLKPTTGMVLISGMVHPGNLRCVATSLGRSTFSSTTAWWICSGVNLANLFRLGRW
jgi:hypothetical protein